MGYVNVYANCYNDIVHESKDKALEGAGSNAIAKAVKVTGTYETEE